MVDVAKSPPLVKALPLVKTRLLPLVKSQPPVRTRSKVPGDEVMLPGDEVMLLQESAEARPVPAV